MSHGTAPRAGAPGRPDGRWRSRWAAWHGRVRDAKAQDFRGSLEAVLRPAAPRAAASIVVVIVLAVGSVFLAVLGPEAARQRDQHDLRRRRRLAAARGGARRTRRSQRCEAPADRPGAHARVHDVDPGQGVDFTALGRVLALVVARLRARARCCRWAQNYLMAGVTQRTIYRLREEVDDKLGRLPLQLLRHAPAR